MQIDEFKRTLRTFQDAGSDFLVDENQILLSVNEETISITVYDNEGNISVTETPSDSPIPARDWILKRLAKIHSLAQRLIDMIPETKWYIPPSASHLKSLKEDPNEADIAVHDAGKCLLEELSKAKPLQTSVLYLTGQAGEGKTSLINEMSRLQAKAFIKKEANWILLPIPLGGRPFLRFDDIIIGVLANKYRFSSLYYESFLYLVKQGIIVPVFDGFEEVFVSNGASETYSAMGTLLKQFDSQGKVVFSARNAYFDFLDLRQQAQFIDVIRTSGIDFQRLKLTLWSKEHFLQYCRNRDISNCEEIHSKIAERLGSSHAILSRAVLVNKLGYLIESKGFDPDRFIEDIYKAGTNDYFPAFIDSLLAREAENWLNDTGSGVYSPLLSIQEHCDLLSDIALEMWMNREESINSEVVYTVVDMFSEAHRKNAKTHTAIRQRIFDHAFLLNTKGRIAFDHEDFRHYFLGEALARLLLERVESDVFNVLRRGSFPANARRTCIKRINRTIPKEQQPNIIEFLLQITHKEGQSSYVHENCNSLIIRILDKIHGSPFILNRLSFPIKDILRDKTFNNVTFTDCCFLESSLESTTFDKVNFVNCSLGTLTIFSNTQVKETVFDNCQIQAVRRNGRDEAYRNPQHIDATLRKLGFIIKHGTSVSTDTDCQPADTPSNDQGLVGFEKMLRYFGRSTHIGENIIRMKLGTGARVFINEYIPRLIRSGVLELYGSDRASNDPHYRLGTTLSSIETALTKANGSFDVFVQSFTR
jgi:hypothetical protein